MEMAKPTESEKERLRSLFAELPGAEIKPMFGNLGAFVNGNLFAGLYGSTVGLRLSEPDRDELMKSSATTIPLGPAEQPLPATWDSRSKTNPTKSGRRALAPSPTS